VPLNTRPIAVTIAVICFFGLGLVAWFNGLSPFACCKRALLGAIFAYIAGTLAVKAINAIMINAMINNKTNQSSKTDSDNKN